MSRAGVGLGLGLVAGILAAIVHSAPSEAAPPRVIEIDVPEPTRPPPPPPPPGGPVDPAEQPTILPDGTVVPASATPGAGGRTIRREARKVQGEAPAMLSGRYAIVQVTTDGETEDYRLKMEREGKALDQDCVTVRRVFDFGPGDVPGLPAEIGISEQQECHKGGLGRYANELWVLMPATWSRLDGTAEGGKSALALDLPPVEATATLVRVRRPAREDLKTPPHWLGPESRLEQAKTRYELVAELPPAGRRRATGPDGQELPPGPTAIHLVGPNVVYHLEPEPADGTFVR